MLALFIANPAAAAAPGELVVWESSGSCRMVVVGATFRFEGCHVNVIDGEGETYGTSGLGNVIVGYNEGGVRSGSATHNLVVGVGNSVTGAGNVLVGRNQRVLANAASVIGGQDNYAENMVHPRDLDTDACCVAVVGGSANEASGAHTAIIGGIGNVASPWSPVAPDNIVGSSMGFVAGGRANYADGGEVIGGQRNSTIMDGTVIGGQDNLAFTDNADPPNNILVTRSPTVVGGVRNEAWQDQSLVVGGERGKASHQRATVVGGLEAFADDIDATAGGGFDPHALGINALALGGLQVTARGLAATAMRKVSAGSRSSTWGGIGSAFAPFSTVMGGTVDANTSCAAQPLFP